MAKQKFLIEGMTKEEDQACRLAGVQGAIIGALAGGHMEGKEGYEYSKSVLIQIAELLNLDIPESVKNAPPRFS